MIDMLWKLYAVMCFALALSGAFAMDSRILPIDRDVLTTNNCVSVKIVLSVDDPSLPSFLQPYFCQNELLAVSNQSPAALVVGGKICVENRSEHQYVFGHPYSRSGYNSLEIDLLQANGSKYNMRHRKPNFLSDDSSSIELDPGKKWECLFSFDERLWNYPPDISTNKIAKIRPRFAFGAYKVDGRYYRTLDEIGKTRKVRTWDDREGELIGAWIEYREHSEQH